VVAGQGTIDHINSGSTQVNQTSHSMAIDWQSFNLDAHEGIRFNQPSQSSAVLNRIFDQNPSQIFGSIEANGRVFLMNPNGMLFGKTVNINVGALVASGLTISLDDFLNENYEFDSLAEAGAVVNRGMIQAATGGSVNLLGTSVSNEGLVVAKQGQVNIGVGNKVTLDFDGDGLIYFQVEGDLLENSSGQESAILNSGEINADGGTILIQAATAENIFNQAINNTGVIKAGRLENNNGVIRLVAENSKISNSGAINVSALDSHSAGEVSILAEEITETGDINASGGVNGDGGQVIVVAQDTLYFDGDISATAGDENGDGGFVELSGLAHVSIQGNVELNASNGESGTLLIDPGSISIVDGIDTAPPGTLDTFNDAWIESQLSSGNLILQTDNSSAGGAEDITVDSAASISWGNTNSLTLEAGNDITIDGTISAASGTLNLQGGQDGAGGNIDLTNSTLSVSTINATGGGGTDTLTGQSAGASWTVTGASSGSVGGALTFSSIENLAGGTGDDDFIVNGGSIASINGGAGTNSLTGNNGANSWTISGASQGSATNVTSFTNIADLIGGTSSDDFTINGGSINSINGGTGTNSLTGNNGANTWSISGASQGSVTGVTSFSNIASIIGGTSSDDFTVSGGSITSIDGGAGTDSLTANNGANSWSITGADSGSVTSVTGFDNIEDLVGGSGVDTFSLTSNFSGDISGGASGDIFDFADTVVVTGAIDGGSGTDQIDWADYTSARNVTLTATGSSDGFQGQQASISGNFDNIDTLVSSNNSETLTAANLSNSWSITGADDGTITSGNSLSFTNFSNVVGGTSADSIVLAGGTLSGSIDGGTGTDSLTANNGGKTFAISGAAAGSLTDVTGGFSNIETLIGGTGGDTFTMNSSFSGGINGGAGSDTIDYTPLTGGVTVTLGTSASAGEVTAIEILTGEPGSTLAGDNGNNTWTTTAADEGTVVWAGGTTDFTGFVTINAGTGDDTFTFDHDFTNTINGGDGADQFNINASVSGTLNGDAGIDTFTIAAATGNVTNSANGGDGNDIFNINETVSGSLSGNNNDDSFIFADTKTIAGSVDGGTGTDILDLSNYTGAVAWSITGTGAGNIDTNNIDFTTIESTEGSSDVDTFTYASGGSLAGTVNGNNASDIFTFQNGSTHLGTINGGAGDETVTFQTGSTFNVASSIDGGVHTVADTVNYSALASASVTLETHVTNVETLTGGGASFTLTGNNATNTWTLDGGSEAVAGYTFSGFNSLIGGTGADTFDITTDYVDSIDGGNGNDIFNIDIATTNTITGGAGNDTFNLNTNFTGTVGGGDGNDTFNLDANIASGTINGDGGTDELVGFDMANTWALNNPNAGTLNTTINFATVEDLTGGTGVDTFNIATAGTLTGTMAGGANNDAYVYSLNSTITGTIDGGTGTDSVDYSAINADRTITLGTTADVTVDTETLTGDTDAAITLIGDNTGRTWTTSGAMAGSINVGGPTVSFTDITNITGGTGSDTFNLDVAFTGTVSGGNGNDTFNITDGQVNGTISGGSGSDTIVADNVANNWHITGSNSGTLNTTQAFSATENLTGGTNTDTFDFDDGDNVTGTINGGTGASVDTLDLSSYSTQLDVELNNVGADNGFTGTETTVGAFNNINTITGGSHTADEIRGRNAVAAWGIDGTNQYVSTNTLDFSDFETLTGHSNVDTFTFTGAQSVSAIGGSGNDRFVFNAGAVLTGSINGAAGTDEIDWSAYTSRDIALSSTGPTTGFNGTDSSASDSIVSGGTDFSNIDSIISSSAGSSDSITGIDAAAAWGIDGTNQYRSTNTLDLSNFETYSGGSNVDTFNIAGAQTMVLNGNGGADAFVFANDAGDLTGTIDGGTGSDTLNWSAVTVSRDVVITNTGSTDGFTGTQADSISIDFDNIDAVIGTDNDDTLTGDNVANTWNITNVDDGTVVSGGNTLTFTNYANLFGGTNDDSFDFGASGSLTGQINDGGGAADSVDYSSVTAAVTIIIGTDISGIETVTGDGTNDTLVGSNIANTWNISSVNDGTVGSVTFVDISNLTGGTNDDDFVMGASGSITGLIDGGVHLAEDTVDYSAVTAPVTVVVDTDVTNIERITGDAVNDKIVGPDAVNIWTINGTEDGTLLTGGDTITFVDMKNVDGNDDVDTFTISANFTGVLSGKDEEDVFNLDNDLTTGSVEGGDGNDTFNYTNGVSISSISGGGGTDTFNADNVVNTWTIDGSDSATLNGQAFSTMENLVGNANVDTFNIDNNFAGTLTGGANNDVFVFADTAVVTGLIDGGTGTDTLDWTSYSTARSATLSGTGANNGFAGADASTTTGFENINVLTGGGAGTDTLIGANAISTWGIDGTNQYTSTNVLDFSSFENLTGGSAADTFNLDVDHSGNLVGGGDDDLFDVADGFNLTGSIDGGAGSDAIDWANYTSDRTITLTAVGVSNGFAGGDTSTVTSISAGFDNINVVTGGAGTTDTLVGIDAIATWGIDGTNQYTSTNILDFSNFQNLTGGSGADTFTLAVDHTGNLVGGGDNDLFDFTDTVNITGSIDGGVGSDTLDWADYTSALTTVLSANGGNNGFSGTDATISLGFDNINVLTASSATNTDSLSGMNADSSWGLDGTSQYTSTNTLDFSNYESLTGNASDDTFVISGARSFILDGGDGDDEFEFADEAAALTGTIDGGDGASNSINWIAASTTRDVVVTGVGSTMGFTGTQATISGGFDNINYVVGSGNGDEITGPNANTNWTFTNALFGNFVSSTRTFGFSNFANFTGGTQIDQFDFDDIATVNGAIDGGTGVDTINWSSYTTGRSVTISGLGSSDGFTGSAASITGGFDNISVLTGSAASDDSLTGFSATAAWGIDGSNQYISTNTLDFSQFENLSGGDGIDTFNLLASHNGNLAGGAGNDIFDYSDLVVLTGSIDGGTGSDTLDWADYLSGRDITLSTVGGNDGFAGSNDTVTLGFDNIDVVIGSSSTANDLTGINAAASWDIDGTNQYTSTNTIDFSNFNNLVGGSDTDNFLFSIAFTGDLDGGSGDDSFVLNGGSVIGAVNGGDGNDAITADNTVNTWNITSANAGDVTGINSFTSIENLTGHSNTDNFIFSVNGSFTGVINGAGSTDSVDRSANTGAISIDLSNNSYLNIENYIGNNDDSTLIANNTTNSWTINSENDGLLNGIIFNDFNHLFGGTESDNFLLTSSGEVTGSIQGGAGDDTLTANNIANVWSITGIDVGNMTSVTSFSQLENLVGGNDTDSFEFSDGSVFSGTINGSDNIDTLDFSAETSTFTVSLNDSNIDNIEIYIGNDSTSTLQADDIANDWVVSAENDGTVAGISFFNFSSLSGGSDTDTFTLNGGTIGDSIVGGDGIDSLTADDVANVWNVTGDDSGSVTGVSGYSQIENLIGNVNTDEFVFTDAGVVSGTLDGKDSIDTVDLSALTEARSIEIANNNYLNIETLIGNNDNLTLVAANTINDWLISGENDGTVSTWSFIDFSYLVGGSEADNFVLSGGSISGSINGQEGADTIHANNTDNVWRLNTDNSGTVTSPTSVVSFESIENLTGGSGNDSFQINGHILSGVIDGNLGSDTLIADHVENNWNITGENSGSLNDEYNFTNVNHLLGGAGVDNFNLSGGTIDGSINGGEGTDTLIADNVVNDWNITGAGAGVVTGVAQFSSIENLGGNNSADNFVFTTTGAISGVLDGAGDNDVVDYTQLQEVITVQLGETGVANVETILASSLDNNLLAENIENNWNINGENAGQVNDTNFSGFANLTGGTNVDTFTFNNGSITGVVNGAEGSDYLQANNTSNSWRVSGKDEGTVNGVITFTSIENLIGGNQTDSVVIGTQGVVSESIDLAGGADNIDYSNVNTATDVHIGQSLNNTEDITAGVNFTLTADDTSNQWYLNEVGSGTLNDIAFHNFAHLNGGANSDYFTFAHDAGVSGSIDGNAGIDTMDWTPYFTVRTVTLTGEGTIDGFRGVEDAIVGGFDNVEEFIGTDVISHLAESLAVAGKQQTDDLYKIAYQTIPDSLFLNRLFNITDTGIRLPKDMLEAQTK